MLSSRALFPELVVAAKTAAAFTAMRPDIPDSIINWVARARLLYGVPFEYLVPDASLLPPESIRFFFLDQNWTDRLVDGAMSVGAYATWERLHTEIVTPYVRDAADLAQAALRKDIRARRNAATSREAFADVDPAADYFTGFILRSRLVSAFPGMEVAARAVDDDAAAPLRPIRIDRPAPDLMLALFQGVAARFTLREPAEAIVPGVSDRQGQEVQIGVKVLVDQEASVQTGPDGKEITQWVPTSPRGKLDINALLGFVKQANQANPDFSSADYPAAVAAALLDFPTELACHEIASVGATLPSSAPRPGEIA